MRAIRFDVLCVHYAPGKGETEDIVGGLLGSAEFNEGYRLGPEVAHMMSTTLTRYIAQEDCRFYLAENGEVYPQFRMEERVAPKETS